MGKGGQQIMAQPGVAEGSKGRDPSEAPRQVTHAELRKHNRFSDAWMTIGTKVYDVSNWSEHPGGSVIFTHAGEDMTDVFNLFHPPSARGLLDKFYIGELVEDSAAPAPTAEEKARAEAQTKFEQAYRNLRSKMITAGLFKLSYGFYVYKFLSQFVLLGVAAACARQPGFLPFVVGAVFLALFWEQAGWLAHDVCHNQLCEMKNGRAMSSWNHALGLMAGNVFQGFSVTWWKDKHNRHHAVPNVHGAGDALNADPDIDTMPLLAWSLKMAELAKSSSKGRFMISIQKFTYLPLLCFARLAWLQNSIQFVWNIKSDGIFDNATKSEDLLKVQSEVLTGFDKVLEQVLIIFHHLWVAVLCAQRGSLGGAVAFWLLAQAICGFVLFSITSLGHNGLPVYEANDKPDYWKLQVTTTRNITGNAFVHWLCGGLEYQVDHHLFPMMPRHSLPKAHELIVSFCKEHGIKYNEASYWKGTWDVLNHLDSVAHEFVAEFPAM
mmetsp:Transcript_7262/g.20935  ORF Transcript_7262/g.20935 Transcript_7262/m.20935 type:complete len:493 (+) Transcript_7262:36-1514(+)